MGISTKGKRLFIARHGETVFNAISRMQGQAEVHTPLTWDGCVQAREMGRALASYLGDDARPQLWSSTAGRALQTLAIIAEQIGADWHQTERDDRLLEIDVGSWSSRTYADIAAEIGPIVDIEHRLFSVRPTGGEWYDDVAARLSHWIGEQAFEQDMLVICHGMTARVLRGLLLGQPPLQRFDAPIAHSLAQGSMVMIRDGVEELVIDGDGQGERA
jgi:probable phosphoglycerate mutase